MTTTGELTRDSSSFIVLRPSTQLRLHPSVRSSTPRVGFARDYCTPFFSSSSSRTTPHRTNDISTAAGGATVSASASALLGTKESRKAGWRRIYRSIRPFVCACIHLSIHSFIRNVDRLI